MNNIATAYETDEEIFSAPTYSYTEVRELQAPAQADPYAAEEISIDELAKGDTVLLNGIPQKVWSKPFHTYTSIGNQIVAQGPWNVTIGGKVRMIADGSKVLRILDPKAANKARMDQLMGR